MTLSFNSEVVIQNIAKQKRLCFIVMVFSWCSLYLCSAEKQTIATLQRYSLLEAAATIWTSESSHVPKHLFITIEVLKILLVGWVRRARFNWLEEKNVFKKGSFFFNYFDENEFKIDFKSVSLVIFSGCQTRQLFFFFPKMTYFQNTKTQYQNSN